MWTPSPYWEDNRRWWHCRNCDHWQLELPAQGLRIPPKVLYYDIETALVKMEIDVFDMRVRSGWLDWHNITRPFYVISWAAAWVDDKTPRLYSDAVTGYEAKRRKDKRCLQGLWDLIDQADYVVGHNVKAFDHKKIETRFLLNNMGRPSDCAAVDTLTLAKKYFKPESQALDYWQTLFGGQNKDHMVREDWEEVNKGNQKIINKMHKYNRGDVQAGINLLHKFVNYIESNGGKKVFK